MRCDICKGEFGDTYFNIEDQKICDNCIRSFVRDREVFIEEHHEDPYQEFRDEARREALLEAYGG